jgi:hypothetical protein
MKKKLETVVLNAKDVPEDSFIYIPKEKRFFFVDDKQIEGSKTIFYFEDIENKSGFIDHHIAFGNYTKITVVSKYTPIKLKEKVKHKSNKNIYCGMSEYGAWCYSCGHHTQCHLYQKYNK